MDFFAHQEAAQRKTWLLIGYFALAVVLMTAAVYFLLLVALGFVGRPDLTLRYFNPPLAAAVTVGMAALIGAASLWKTLELSAGGEKVAMLLGGRRLQPDSQQHAERRLLNIVEEMALAAGLPVPPVFVLADEPGINAFAAGHSPADAVIGVSQGALEHLNRDELQGVVAHEFSHILRGDMRLNVRLIGLLYGILVLSLCGYYLFRILGSGSTSRGSKKGGTAAGLILIGLGVWLIGAIGLFFGRLIKAAVSRQREFLADAASVQFTRNPDGIAGALKKIASLPAGSTIQSPEAENASHMFFASGVSSWLLGALNTHPPLVERIRRIDPMFDGTLPKAALAAVAAPGPSRPAVTERRPAAAALPDFDPARRFPIDPLMVLSTVGSVSAANVLKARQMLDQMPRPLLAAAEEPFSARAVIACLLLATDAETRKSQLDEIGRRLGQAALDEVLRLAPIVSDQGPGSRLPLIELTQPALKNLSHDQYVAFRDTLDALIRADRRLSQFEFILERTLVAHLNRHFQAPGPAGVRFHAWNAVSKEAACVLSALSHVGHSTHEAAQAAYAAALQQAQVADRAEMISRDQCTLSAIGAALDKLATASPGIKKRLLAAAVVAASQDGQVTVHEAELLRAIADSIDCPLPPLFTASPLDAPDVETAHTKPAPQPSGQ